MYHLEEKLPNRHVISYKLYPDFRNIYIFKCKTIRIDEVQ